MFVLHFSKVHLLNHWCAVVRYCNEAAAERVLYRGTFGTAMQGGWLANALDMGVRSTAWQACLGCMIHREILPL